MVGNVNFVAATAGVFGIVGLILLFIARKSRRTTKRKDSNQDAMHVENPNSRPTGADSPSLESIPVENLSSPEKILYRYLNRTYWEKGVQQCEDLLPDSITYKDFKQVCRVTHTSPHILVIYSKKSVWELGLSNRAERGYREQFAFLMRGPESPSDKVRMVKMDYVRNDMIEFRQVHVFLITLPFLLPVYTFFFYKNFGSAPSTKSFLISHENFAIIVLKVS